MSHHPTNRMIDTKPMVAVVTGASGGIGRAIAMEFARRGSCVVVHARNNWTGLASLLDAIAESADPPNRDTTLAMVCDLCNVDSMRSFADAAFAWHGYVNVWIHAAGTDVLTGEARHWSFEKKLQSLWELDVRSVSLLSRHVAERMSRTSLPHSTKPSIIHLGWDQANEGMEGDSGQYFSAIKAAVAAFSKSLAKSYSGRVRVNSILPGWIKTDWGNNASNEWSQRAISESMLGRWGAPEDVARVAAFLSLGDGEFINGQSIAVNGGWQPGVPSVQSKLTRD